MISDFRNNCFYVGNVIIETYLFIRLVESQKLIKAKSKVYFLGYKFYVRNNTKVITMLKLSHVWSRIPLSFDGNIL